MSFRTKCSLERIYIFIFLPHVLDSARTDIVLVIARKYDEAIHKYCFRRLSFRFASGRSRNLFIYNEIPLYGLNDKLNLPTFSTTPDSYRDELTTYACYLSLRIGLIFKGLPLICAWILRFLQISIAAYKAFLNDCSLATPFPAIS